jgi:hypothetical protein
MSLLACGQPRHASALNLGLTKGSSDTRKAIPDFFTRPHEAAQLIKILIRVQSPTPIMASAFHQILFIV